MQHSLQAHACCAGPVDAAYKAVDTLVGVAVELEDYTINRSVQLAMMCGKPGALHHVARIAQRPYLR
jgi:predicted RNA polymerase sigma factor